MPVCEDLKGLYRVGGPDHAQDVPAPADGFGIPGPDQFPVRAPDVDPVVFDQYEVIAAVIW